ncbi:phosphotransferase family protein [Saccharopolyspora terrae]|uniref:phosphotransferase family protein n=1 Tax=Saccharopolyspora terrae TaxID=2530384 RepID=UPI001F23A84D|nr:phosphotransferase family protein [Saccharopolyspora terrae]
MTSHNATSEQSELRELVCPEELGRLLADSLQDPAWQDMTWTLITGGKSNLTFELTSASGQLVLRRPPRGPLLPRAHDMGREVRVLHALANTTVPVPEVVVQDTTSSTIGAPFYVMEKVSGHVLRDEMPDDYARTADERRAIADSLVDVLAALHALDPDELGLADFGRPAGFLARQIKRWRDQWEASRTSEVPAVDALANELAVRMPESPPPAVVHGDFRLDNCLMSRNEPSTVAAVLDWELSTLGDPLTDVGLLLFYWREVGEAQRLLSPTVTTLPGFPGRDHLVDRYVAHTGRNVDAIHFYEAFAHFKFAVIAQGIAARVAGGAMAGQDFGDLSDEIIRIAEEGLAIIGRSA